MSGILPENLDELRRQVEEDYRLDMAALEHLSRRFSGAAAADSAAAYMPASNGAERGASRGRSAPPAPRAVASDAQSEEADGSLRSMFPRNPKPRGAS